MCDHNNPDNYYQSGNNTHIFNARTILLRGLDTCTPDNLGKRHKRHLEPLDKQYTDNTLYIYPRSGTMRFNNNPYD